ncbi:hypothetical protein SSCG_02598 [Streptomyces clavuligerus]|nr:hypothetical protein SSCG_02598 [Streptomyces clavuligerus]
MTSPARPRHRPVPTAPLRTAVVLTAALALSAPLAQAPAAAAPAVSTATARGTVDRWCPPLSDENGSARTQ